MGETSIEWTDATWNPTRGCSRVSPGCGGGTPGGGGGCYAEKIAARFSGPGMAYEGLAEMTADGGRWTGDLRLVEEALELPLRWRKPKRVFVNSMSDLFHEALNDDQIDRVFAVMALAPQHTFQVLTKRSERMARYIGADHRAAYVEGRAKRLARERCAPIEAGKFLNWPLANVWLGVSVENQKYADERIPHLLATPAAVRFLSCEPLLGPVDLRLYPLANGCGPRPIKTSGIDWVIVGGESGGKARPFDLEWARAVVEQCREADVPCFVKQMGARPIDSALDGCDPDDGTPLFKDHKGGNPSEWPADLRVREFPEVRR